MRIAEHRLLWSRPNYPVRRLGECRLAVSNSGTARPRHSRAVSALQRDLVCFGSDADICGAKSYVCIPPNSDRKSGPGWRHDYVRPTNSATQGWRSALILMRSKGRHPKRSRGGLIEDMTVCAMLLKHWTFRSEVRFLASILRLAN